MGKHGNPSDGDGQGDYDHDKTKDVNDAGGGKRSADDQGDE